MKAEKKGKYIYIRLKLLLRPRLSSTGKSLLFATTRGPRPAKFKFRKQFARVIANVFIPANPDA
jgi:hypothetical protein